MHTQSFDTIVIGLGAMGASTLLQLAKRGQRVLGIDRYNPPHDHGSTHGETRVTRCAIGEGSHYVPLVLRSHEIWRELEAETGAELLTQCGALIMAGNGDTAPVHGKTDFLATTIAAAQAYNIAHEVLRAPEVMARYPNLCLRGDETAYFEPEGGFVRPEACVRAQLHVARKHGATILPNTQVTAIENNGSGIRITTRDGTTHHAADAVLAAGSWSPGLAGPPIAPHLRILRQVLHWFETDTPELYTASRFPVFIWAHGNTADDSFYGFPIPHDGTGVKVAREQYATVTENPDHTDRTITRSEIQAMFDDHVAGRLLGLRPQSIQAKTCLYTSTQDGDFLIDHLPDNDRVLLLSACSGHGFKHSAALGETIAQSLTENTPLPTQFSTNRLSLSS